MIPHRPHQIHLIPCEAFKSGQINIRNHFVTLPLALK